MPYANKDHELLCQKYSITDAYQDLIVPEDEWYGKISELADDALGEGHGDNWLHDTDLSTWSAYLDGCEWWINASWGADGPESLEIDDPDYEKIRLDK